MTGLGYEYKSINRVWLIPKKLKSLSLQGTKAINKIIVYKQAKNLKSCYALAVSSVYIGEKVIHRKEWYNG